MTDTENTQSEPTVAQKRQALQANGVAVGSRGKLSAEAEAAYAQLVSEGRVSQA
jgi:hypothetical protein